MSSVSLDAVMTRLNEIAYQFNVLSLRMDELEQRFESTNILGALAVHEESCRLAKLGVEAWVEAETLRRVEAVEQGEDLVGV